jgi:hypothetical protein
VPGTDVPSVDPAGAARQSPDHRTVRELLVALSRTEDELREWRSRRGQRDVPVPDVHALLSQQRELVAALRRLSGTIDLTPFDGVPGPTDPAEHVAS